MGFQIALFLIETYGDVPLSLTYIANAAPPTDNFLTLQVHVRPEPSSTQPSSSLRDLWRLPWFPVPHVSGTFYSNRK